MIDQVQKEILTEEAILYYLTNGIVPSQKQIQDYIDTKVGKDFEYNTPISLLREKFERGEVSSAAKFNNTTWTLSSDLNVLYRDLYNLTYNSACAFNKWRDKIKKLSQRAKKLSNRVDDLLFSREDTEGYFTIIDGDLRKNDILDPSVSGCEIDYATGSIRIGKPKISSNSLSPTKIDLYGYNETDIDFVTSDPEVQTNSFAINKNLVMNMFDENDNTAFYIEIRKKSNSGTTFYFDLNLRSKMIINRARMLLNSSCFASGLSIDAQLLVRNDNQLDFTLVGDKKGFIDPNCEFLFEEREVRTLRFYFTIPALPVFDKGYYAYLLGVNHLNIFRDSYSTTEEGFGFNTFQTIAIQGAIPGTKENIVAPFTRAKLIADEELNDQIIDYYLQAQDSNIGTWSDWMQVSPEQRNDGIGPVAYFSSISTQTIDDCTNIINSKDNDVLVDKATDIDSLPTVFRDHELIRNNQKGITFVNSCIPDTHLADNRLDYSSIDFRRNVGYWSLNSTVRGIPVGWGFNDPYYFTYIEVKSPNGVLVNFAGNSDAYLNKKRVAGKTRIPQGVHYFETHKNNFANVEDYYTYGFTASSMNKDPLYPNNHKYIIEGVSYNTSYDGTRYYNGVTYWFEAKLKRVSFYDIIKDDYNYSNYSLDIFNNYGLLVVWYDIEKFDRTNEHFSLEYKISNTTQSVMDTIRLKAIMKTKLESVSPVLKSFKLKLG